MATYFRVIRSLDDERTLKAGEDMVKARLISVEATSGDVIYSTASSTNIIGVTLEDRDDGEKIAFATGNMEVILTCSAAITVGQSIQEAASGKAAPYAADGTPTGALGVAQEATATDGDLFRAFVNLPKFEDVT